MSHRKLRESPFFSAQFLHGLAADLALIYQLVESPPHRLRRRLLD